MLGVVSGMVNTLHSPFNYWLLSQLPQLNCFSKEKREHKTTHDRYRFYLYSTTFIKIISLLFSFLMFLHAEFHSLFHKHSYSRKYFRIFTIEKNVLCIYHTSYQIFWNFIGTLVRLDFHEYVYLKNFKPA